MQFIKHLPNIITISRIISAIFMVFYYYFNLPLKYEILFAVFTIASISDFFDGYLSRKWNVVSNLGKCLDPISDKLLLITALIILVESKNINVIVAFIIISRELIISGLREFLSNINVQLPVSKLAKWKTSLQLTGICMCFFSQSYHFAHLTATYIHFKPFNLLVLHIGAISQIVIICATIITLQTGISYIYNSAKYLK